MKGKRTAARRMTLRSLLEGHDIKSQDELQQRLAEAGFSVTQATVSRDLAAIGAQKQPAGPDGAVRYLLSSPPEASPDRSTLSERMAAFAVEISASANLVVLKTLPGAAGTVADALDSAAPEGLLGTVGGDDTVLLVTRDPAGGEALAAGLRLLLEE